MRTLPVILSKKEPVTKGCVWFNPETHDAKVYHPTRGWTRLLDKALSDTKEAAVKEALENIQEITSEEVIRLFEN